MFILKPIKSATRSRLQLHFVTDDSYLYRFLISRMVKPGFKCNEV